MKNLARHYEKLTPTERAALTIEALARKDMAEADRLADACPQFSYQGRDLAYTMRLSELHRLALLYENQRLGLLSRITCVSGLIAYFDAKNDDRADEMLGRLTRLQGDIRAWDHAWDRLCETADVDPVAALEAFAIDRRLASFSELQLGNYEPTKETLEEARASLIGMWQSVISRFG